MTISSERLVELAKQLEEFSERGVFTAEHRWQTVVDAAAALRAVASDPRLKEPDLRCGESW
jgi:hypothetical protein